MMLEILKYATSGFWTFIGCFLLLWLAGYFAFAISGQFVRLIRVLVRPRKGD